MYELFLGKRYLKAKRKQTFISVISVISALGVMMGVMALIIVLSVMNGFRADLMSKILGVNSHLLVLSYGGGFRDNEKIIESVNAVDDVVASTPFINTQVMFNNSGSISAAVLWGIDPDTAGRVVSIEESIKEPGALASLKNSSGGFPSIIIGCELAKQTRSSLGDVVTLVAPEGKLTPMGRVPNTREFKVTGIFSSGMYEYDASMAYILLEETQDFLAFGDRVTGLAVKVGDVFNADRTGWRIQEKLGYPFRIQDWKARNKSLFAALELEKYTMFVILTMIVLVGALNIISTLVMVVMEKTRDVAILRAMGASSKSIMSIFMIQGLFVGLVGTLAGLASGLGICYLLANYITIPMPPDVYYLSQLPVKVESMDVLIIALSAVLISFLATIYPSWYASRLNPVEAFRYE